MKTVVVEADSEATAITKVSLDHGVEVTEVKLLKQEQQKFTFELLSCGADVKIKISRDGMKAVLEHVYLPIGPKAPALSAEVLEKQIIKKGVKFGIKSDAIARVVFDILSNPKFNESIPLNINIAEGLEPISAQSGKPKWNIELKLFKEKDPKVFVRAGDIICQSANAQAGQDGQKVNGEMIKAPVEDPHRISTGKGIVVERNEKGSFYKAESCGWLFYDEGIRLRLESEVVDLADGLKAAVVTDRKNYAGELITAKHLIETATKFNVSKGMLTEAQIENEIRSAKKWPAQILVAVGKDAEDGKPGQIIYRYKEPQGSTELDVLRAKLEIVFPGETLIQIRPPSEPKSGFTVYGEELRGRPYNELPIYAGANVTKSVEGDLITLKSTIYGKVKIVDERISVENILQVSKDAMKVTLDLFPQKKMTASDLVNLCKEKDILFGFDKDLAELKLEKFYEKKTREESFVVAEGKSWEPGVNAKVVYRFDPKSLKTNTLFGHKDRILIAFPNDLIMTKILPRKAQEGTNVYREKIPVPEDKLSKDVEIISGREIKEIELGDPLDDKNPLRIEYRSQALGSLVWNQKTLDVKPFIQIDDEENFVKIGIAPGSDFGTRFDLKIIQQIAEQETIRVDLEMADISKALKQPRGEDGSPTSVVIAKSIPAEHGTDAVVEYYITYNGKKIEEVMDPRQKEIKEEAPLFCDFVRPGDVLGKKVPPGDGKDGMSVFGRRIRAERGMDEPWMIGFGIEKSTDGLQIFCNSKAPGYVLIENRRLTVVDSTRISSDKMTGMVTIYPSKNPRFPVTEEKVLSMIRGAGIKFGIKEEVVKKTLQEVVSSESPAVEVVIAEGRPPQVGKDASYEFAVKAADSAGNVREDGSIDFRGKSVFQSVKKGQLLITKNMPTKGADGMDVLGQVVPGIFGKDSVIRPGVGVELGENKLQYYAIQDGIVEITEDAARVIPGLLIPGDVDYKTGNIEADQTEVFIKGSVLPGFSVKSEKDITIDKEVESAFITAKENIKIRGGIIGKDKGLISAGKTVEALYINSGAKVEAVGDIRIGSEILNSEVRTSGKIICEAGAGTIYGGEIWAFEGIRAKIVGAAGAETPTKIMLGMDYLKLIQAEKFIEQQGYNNHIVSLTDKLKDCSDEVKELGEKMATISKSGTPVPAELQTHYRSLLDTKSQLDKELDKFKKQKSAILDSVPRNKKVKLEVIETIHPGVIIQHADVVWEIKEALRGVEISWSEATRNIISKRL